MEAEGEEGDQHLFNSQRFMGHRNCNSYFSGKYPGGKEENPGLLLPYQNIQNPMDAYKAF